MLELLALIELADFQAMPASELFVGQRRLLALGRSRPHLGSGNVIRPSRCMARHGDPGHHVLEPAVGLDPADAPAELLPQAMAVGRRLGGVSARDNAISPTLGVGGRNSGTRTRPVIPRRRQDTSALLAHRPGRRPGGLARRRLGAAVSRSDRHAGEAQVPRAPAVATLRILRGRLGFPSIPTKRGASHKFGS